MLMHFDILIFYLNFSKLGTRVFLMVTCLENSSSFSLNIIYRLVYVSDTDIIT